MILKSRGLLVFFVLPYAAVLVLFFVLSSFNRSFLRDRTERLAGDQLLASADILRVGVRDLLEEGVPADRLLGGYKESEEIYFMAVLNAEMEVLDWASRFEGYLPFSRQAPPPERTWTTESPAGRIFHVFVPFTTADGARYYLYLGYSLAGLEEMISRSRFNFWLVFAILSAAGLILFRGVYGLHRHALDRAEEATAERLEKDRFKEISGYTAGIAHEIKNPLNSLGLLCELMGKKAPAELAGDAAAGRAEVQKIGRIIDQLSAALRPVSLRKESVLLEAVLRDLKESIGPAITAKGLVFRVEAPSGLRFRVDRGLFEQALENIIRNAVEATDRGWIELRAEEKRGRVHVSIQDTGPGLPAGGPDRLFEPFFSTKSDGRGIGLFLSRKIIETHGGTIRAGIHEGGGARFEIEIPGERG